jgi:hypothetical protein
MRPLFQSLSLAAVMLAGICYTETVRALKTVFRRLIGKPSPYDVKRAAARAYARQHRDRHPNAGSIQ